MFSQIHYLLLFNAIKFASTLNHQAKAELEAIQINRNIHHCHFHFITALDCSSNPFFLNPLSYEIIPLDASNSYMYWNRTWFNKVKVKGIACVYTIALFPSRDEIFSAYTITNLNLRSRYLYVNDQEWLHGSFKLYPKENRFFLAIVVDSGFKALDQFASHVRFSATHFNTGGFFAYIVINERISWAHIHCYDDVNSQTSSGTPTSFNPHSLRDTEIWKNTHTQICRKEVKYPFRGNRILGSISDLLEHFNMSTTSPKRYRYYFEESRLTGIVRSENAFPGPEWELHIVPYSSSSFSFISCIGRRDLSFSIYVKPFSSYVWLISLITFCAVVLFLYCLIRLLSSKETHLYQIAIFHVLSPLLGADWSLPTRVSSKQAYRLGFVYWLLLGGVAMTNAYLGCMITDLTSPVGVSGTLKKFQDLNKSSCTTLCECDAEERARSGESVSKLGKQGKLYKILAEPLAKDESVEADDFQLLQRESYDFSQKVKVDFSFSYEEYISKHNNCSQGGPESSVTRAFKMLMLIQQGYDLFPKHAKKIGSIRQAIEAELVECREAVFVKRAEKMGSEFDYLTKSYKNLSFFTSESEFDGMDGITVPEDGTGMKTWLQTYIEVGLLQMHRVKMEKMQEIQRYNSFTRNYSKQFHKAFSPTSIKDSIQTLFFLVLLLLFVAIIVIGFEICSSLNVHKIVASFRKAFLASQKFVLQTFRVLQRHVLLCKIRVACTPFSCCCIACIITRYKKNDSQCKDNI